MFYNEFFAYGSEAIDGLRVSGLGKAYELLRE